MKALLISNSGKPLYEWCYQEIIDFVGDNEVTFISAANIFDPQKYYEEVKERFISFGLRLNHLNLDKNPDELIEKTKIFLVGGGNTFNLLNKLKELKLLEKIRSKIKEGAFYIGVSAGANIAGPNILTTNDWNVVGLNAFDALNLVPFNINPHYIYPHDKKVFSGESRDDRIFEYLAVHKNPVLALEEKTLLRIENNLIEVKGIGKVKVFFSKTEQKEFKPGDKLDLFKK